MPLRPYPENTGISWQYRIRCEAASAPACVGQRGDDVFHPQAQELRTGVWTDG